MAPIIANISEGAGLVQESMPCARYSIPRVDHARRMLLHALRHGTVLIEAPSGSGKTTMLEMVYEQKSWLQEQYPSLDFEFFLIKMRDANDFDTPVRIASNNMYDSWGALSSAGRTRWDEGNRVTFWLVDEVHLMYEKVRFCEKLKDICGGLLCVRVIMAAPYWHASVYSESRFRAQPYGIVTIGAAPEEASVVAPQCQLRSLSLSHQETVALIDKFQQVEGIALSLDMVCHIHDQAAGQVGLIVITLSYLADNLRPLLSTGLECGSDEFKAAAWFHLRSAGHLSAFENARSVPILSLLTIPQLSVIKAVLEKGGSYGDYNGGLWDATIELYKCGVLVDNGSLMRSLYGFTSPIHAQILSHWVYNTDVHKDSFEDFLLTVLRRMRPEALVKTMAYAARTWQPWTFVYDLEFYRVACSVLPLDPVTERRTIMSPSIGKVPGKGFLDFYVADKAWGFDILRDGDELENLLGRCAPGGRYHRLVQFHRLSHYAVLDLRLSSTPLPEFCQRTAGVQMYQVCFGAKYMRAKVYKADSLLECVAIGGDL